MKPQRGFSLVMAIFILVVLGLLGGYMARLMAVEVAASNDALQGARAYQAARAGIEWALARINGGGACADVNAQTAMTFTGLDGFSVTLTCSSVSDAEADQMLVIYQINALAQSGVYGSLDYWARELEIRFAE